MQLTLDVPEDLVQQVIDIVNELKKNYGKADPVCFTLPNDAVSGLLLSEQSLAKDWLNEEEDKAWAHLQSVKWH